MVRHPPRKKIPGGFSPGAAIIAKVLCLGLLAAGIVHPAFAGDVAPSPLNLADARLAQDAVLPGSPAESQSAEGRGLAHPDFKREPASQAVRQMAGWVVGTTDNQGLPFVIIDKIGAKVFVFDLAGKLSGAAPALLGLAVGDDAIAEIRNRKMADIGPELRVTPAGRFLASLGLDPAGKEILWVDYDNSIALHSVATNRPQERRLERLASSTPLDRRISWGCINVPKKFYESVVSPAFKGTQGVVYVLPETRLPGVVFGFE